MSDTKAETQPSAAGAEAQATLEELVPLSIDTLSPEQFEDLKTRAAKADEHWERLLRVTADFDNFRKRAAREKQESVRFANEALLERLIPVVDNFDMALAAAQNTQGESSQSLQTGINMIYQQLKQLLIDSGLEEIEATNKPFDPNLHEAVSQRDVVDVPEGQVVQQLRKGYKLRERLIRPATVIIARKPST